MIRKYRVSSSASLGTKRAGVRLPFEDNPLVGEDFSRLRMKRDKCDPTCGFRSGVGDDEEGECLSFNVAEVARELTTRLSFYKALNINSMDLREDMTISQRDDADCADHQSR